MADESQLDKNTERKINLTALKKHDKNVDKIIETASSVAHYKFDSSTESWTKTDMEGSLFVYTRLKKPEVAFFIMNRLSTDNCKVFVSDDMEFKIQEPFVLCRTSPTEIIGIWFYDQHECSKIGSLLERLAEVAGRPEALQRFIKPIVERNNRPEKPPVDVLSMFAKATKVYEEEKQKPPNTREMGTKARSKNEDKGARGKKSGNTPSRSKQPEFKRTVSVPAGDYGEERNSQMNSTIRSDQDRQLKARESFQEVHKRDADELMSLIKGGIKRTRSVTLPSEQIHELNTMGTIPHPMLEEKPAIKTGQKPMVIDVAELEAKVLQNSPPKFETPKKIPEATISTSTTNGAHYRTKDENTIPSDDMNSRAFSTTSLLTPSSLAARPDPAGTSITNSPIGRGRGILLQGAKNSLAKSSPVSENFSLKDSVKGRFNSQRKLFPDAESKATQDTDASSVSSNTSLMGPSAFQIASSKLSSSEAIGTGNETMLLSKQLFVDSMIHLMQDLIKGITKFARK